MPDLRLLFTALALVATMAAIGALGWRSRLGSLLLFLLSFVWLTVDKLWEGPVLFGVGRSHGVVLTDVVGFVGVLAAAALWLRVRRPLRTDLLRLVSAEKEPETVDWAGKSTSGQP